MPRATSPRSKSEGRLSTATSTDLPLRCRCGTVRGVARHVTPSTVNRCFCYCDDCQAFAHFLGRADDVLDAHGGTEITQMSQANVGFTGAAVPQDGSPELVMVARVLSKVLRWRLRNDQKRSPLLDAVTGKPVVEPRVLAAAEREELRQRCARWRERPVKVGA